jgi:hypothetical protein
MNTVNKLTIGGQQEGKQKLAKLKRTNVQTALGQNTMWLSPPAATFEVTGSNSLHRTISGPLFIFTAITQS